MLCLHPSARLVGFPGIWAVTCAQGHCYPTRLLMVYVSLSYGGLESWDLASYSHCICHLYSELVMSFPSLLSPHPLSLRTWESLICGIFEFSSQTKWRLGLCGQDRRVYLPAPWLPALSEPVSTSRKQGDNPLAWQKFKILTMPSVDRELMEV